MNEPRFDVIPPGGIDLPAVDITLVEHINQTPAHLGIYLMFATVFLIAVAVGLSMIAAPKSSRALIVSGGIAKTLAAVMGVTLIALGVAGRVNEGIPDSSLTLDSASIAALDEIKSSSGISPWDDDREAHPSFATDLSDDDHESHYGSSSHKYVAREHLHNVGDHDDNAPYSRVYFSGLMESTSPINCGYTLLSSETDYLAWLHGEHAGLVDQVNTYRLQCDASHIKRERYYS